MEKTFEIYSNSERSEQCLVTECFFNLFLEVFSYLTNQNNQNFELEKTFRNMQKILQFIDVWMRKNTFRFPLCCSKAKHCRNAIERVLGQKKLLKLSIKCPVLLNDLVGIFPKSLLNDQVHLRKNQLYWFISGPPRPVLGLY